MSATAALRLDAPLPPEAASPEVQALWWSAKGEWARAHAIVADLSGSDAAWVHAFLHRAEGDPDNAGYWYRRAGRPPARGSLEDERDAIVAALLR